jgi:hypothetical protein
VRLDISVRCALDIPGNLFPSLFIPGPWKSAERDRGSRYKQKGRRAPRWIHICKTKNNTRRRRTRTQRSPRSDCRSRAAETGRWPGKAVRGRRVPSPPPHALAAATRESAPGFPRPSLPPPPRTLGLPSPTPLQEEGGGKTRGKGPFRIAFAQRRRARK